ncbi:MAG: sugar ABC transporter substrate-binding protein [Lachnospiraceae bacterium]|nr:sugar ABC transporter substrate-binding protein [Lachnospiraceae bacterium]
MKKILSIGLVAVMLSSLLVGCTDVSAPAPAAPAAEAPAAEADTGAEAADEGSAATGYNIAVLIPGSVAYFTATRAGSDEAAAKYGCNLSYSDANWDAATQLSQIEDAISKGVDMIAVCASDAEGILPGIEAANEAGVPILTFTNAVGTDESGTVDGVVSYIGQNEVDTGKLCAKIAGELLGEKGGKIVCIEGKPGTFPQIWRTKGFEEGIEGTNMEIVYKQSGEWDKEKAMSIAEDVLQKGDQVDLFFCQDDGMATGVGEVLEEAGMRDKIKVVGLGGSIQGLQALKDGVIDGNTFLSAKEEGYKAIETCVKYLNGEEVEPRTLVVQVPVTKENVDEFEGEW